MFYKLAMRKPAKQTKLTRKGPAQSYLVHEDRMRSQPPAAVWIADRGQPDTKEGKSVTSSDCTQPLTLETFQVNDSNPAWSDYADFHSTVPASTQQKGRVSLNLASLPAQTRDGAMQRVESYLHWLGGNLMIVIDSHCTEPPVGGLFALLRWCPC